MVVRRRRRGLQSQPYSAQAQRIECHRVIGIRRCIGLDVRPTATSTGCMLQDPYRMALVRPR
jgi:hypothetical protein